MYYICVIEILDKSITINNKRYESNRFKQSKFHQEPK